MIKNRISPGAVCQKIFKTDILKKTFAELDVNQHLTMHEDILQNICAAYFCEKTLHLDYMGYIYFANHESITKSTYTLEKSIHHLEQSKTVKSKLKTFFTRHNIDKSLLRYPAKNMLWFYLSRPNNKIILRQNRRALIPMLIELDSYSAISMLIDCFPDIPPHNPYSKLYYMNKVQKVKFLSKITLESILKKLRLLDLVKSMYKKLKTYLRS